MPPKKVGFQPPPGLHASLINELKSKQTGGGDADPGLPKRPEGNGSARSSSPPAVPPFAESQKSPLFATRKKRTVLKEGYLRMKSLKSGSFILRKSSWKVAWLSLAEDDSFMLKKKGNTEKECDSSKMAMVAIAGVKTRVIPEEKSSKKRTNSFEVVFPHAKKNYVFATETEEEMLEWVTAFNLVGNVSPPTSPRGEVSSSSAKFGGYQHATIGRTGINMTETNSWKAEDDDLTNDRAQRTRSLVIPTKDSFSSSSAPHTEPTSGPSSHANTPCGSDAPIDMSTSSSSTSKLQDAQRFNQFYGTQQSVATTITDGGVSDYDWRNATVQSALSDDSFANEPTISGDRANERMAELRAAIAAKGLPGGYGNVGMRKPETHVEHSRNPTAGRNFALQAALENLELEISQAEEEEGIVAEETKVEERPKRDLTKVPSSTIQLIPPRTKIVDMSKDAVMAIREGLTEVSAKAPSEYTDMEKRFIDAMELYFAKLREQFGSLGFDDVASFCEQQVNALEERQEDWHGSYQLSEEDERDIALCAAEIFSRDPDTWTKEEEAYVNALHASAQEIANMERRLNLRAGYGRAGGTVLFAKDTNHMDFTEAEYIRYWFCELKFPSAPAPGSAWQHGQGSAGSPGPEPPSGYRSQSHGTTSPNPRSTPTSRG